MRYRPTSKARQQVHFYKVINTTHRYNHWFHSTTYSVFHDRLASSPPIRRSSSRVALKSWSRCSEPRLGGHTKFRARDGLQRRLQHTQASVKDNGEDEGDERFAFDATDVVGDRSSGYGQQNRLLHDLAVAGFKLKPQTGSGAIEALLHAIRKFVPNATPIVQCNAGPSENAGDKDDNWKSTTVSFQIEIANSEYDISCTKVIALEQGSQNDLRSVLEELAHEYICQIAIHVQNDQQYDGHANLVSFYMLHRQLDLERVSVIHTTVDVAEFDDGSCAQLFQAQVYAGHEALGHPQVWTDRIIAEQLARASAYADVLQRTEQIGLSQEVVSHSSETTRSTPEKSRELQRATPRDVPRVYDVSLHEKCITAMLYAMNCLRLDGLPDEVQLQPFEQSTTVGRSPVTPENSDRTFRMNRTSNGTRRSSPEWRAIREQRNKLPIREAGVPSQICRLVEHNDVLILVSETGSGKTTQLPQILLEEAIEADKGAACNITCTQPRRIAATSVAARVAQERGTYVGGSVGYYVRFDNRSAEETGSITYSTAGVLLKLLQDNWEEVLQGKSHIVVDEVHERDLTVDLLLAFLRNLMRKRKLNGQAFPKIILMSATMRTMDFERYFAETYEGFTPRVASITIPGRTYHVTANMLDDIIPAFMELYPNDKHMLSLLKESQGYLEWEDEFAAEKEQLVSIQDQSHGVLESPHQPPPSTQMRRYPWQDSLIPYSLITATVIHTLRCEENGDILIFLPGMKEMDDLADMLQHKVPAELGIRNPSRVRVHKLHSALYETNAKVFEAIPEGCRRIILSTTISQTSITLPDVVHVIDSGKRREKVYDQVSRKSDFRSAWIDQATSLQRRGRAGRVRSGHYWAMFSEARFASMSEKATPDIHTSDLTTSSLILKSHSDDIDLRQFFGHTLDCPDPVSVTACIEELKEMGMLTSDERITPLGKFCSDFPLHPAKARGLLLGRLFSCFTPLMVVACHDISTPLIYTPVRRKEMYHTTLQYADVSDDDRHAFIKAFLEYDSAVQSQSIEDMAGLEAKHVRPEAYQSILRTSRQVYSIMAEYGLVRPQPTVGDKTSVFGAMFHHYDTRSHRTNLFKALALSVVDTNLAVWDAEERAWLAKDVKCMLRPYSVNTMQSLKLLHRPPERRPGEVIGFTEMVNNVIAGSRPYLVETSSITPLTAMLFGGPIAVIDDNTIEIDGWLRYRVCVRQNRNGSEEAASHIKSPAMVIFEFRKVIDRVLTLAFSDVRNLSRLSHAEKRNKRFNAYFYGHRLISRLTKELCQILDADASHWDDVIREMAD